MTKVAKMRSLLLRIVALLIQLILIGIVYRLISELVARFFDLRIRRYQQLPLVEILLPAPNELPGPNGDA